jgi:hypothetical protein
MLKVAYVVRQCGDDDWDTDTASEQGNLPGQD